MCIRAVPWPQAGAGPREARLTVIRTCQYARRRIWRGVVDKFQIVSIADERSAEDARGVTLDLPLLNKSHLPSSSMLPQAGKLADSPTLCSPSAPVLPHPSAYLRPHSPPHPFLLTLAKPLCMLIGGGLIQFAAVVDQ